MTPARGVVLERGLGRPGLEGGLDGLVEVIRALESHLGGVLEVDPAEGVLQDDDPLLVLGLDLEEVDGLAEELEGGQVEAEVARPVLVPVAVVADLEEVAADPLQDPGDGVGLAGSSLAVGQEGRNA